VSDKPSYLGLLNAIANGEAEAERYLEAWIATTPRDDVRGVLSTVALREGEHAKAFAKRMCELGYSVIERPDSNAAKRLKVAASTKLTDREKFEKLGLGRREPSDQGESPDIFSGMFRDRSIDIQTGALLGRYIAEERDTGRLFEACYAALVAEDAECADDVDATERSLEPASVGERLDRIERVLEKLVAERV
jgi:rubrerythrin